MTTHDDDHPRPRVGVPASPAAMDAELAALGEAPLGPDELTDELEVDDDPDVRTVATLVAIAHTDLHEAPPLSELSQRRVWARLEGRIAAAGLARDHALRASGEVVLDPAAPAANSGPGWRSVIAGLAVAAVLILPRLSSAPAPASSSAAEHASVQALGATARDAVSALGDAGEARARSLASSYATRLRSEEGGGSR